MKTEDIFALTDELIIEYPKDDTGEIEAELKGRLAILKAWLEEKQEAMKYIPESTWPAHAFYRNYTKIAEQIRRIEEVLK